MIVDLQIAYSPAPLRRAAAWFISGDSAVGWLDELTRWQSSLAQARLHVVPQSAKSAAPCGVLVLGASPGQGCRSAHVLPYGIAGSRLYLPIEAGIEPPIADDELNDLVGETPHLWHPQAGLIALDPAFGLRVADLLEPPPFSERAWDVAVPGVAMNGRLLSIEPDGGLSFQDVLEQGREDIGTQSTELGALPPAPAEPWGGSVGEIVPATMAALAKAIHWLAQQLPHTASHRTWINDVEDWAARRLAKARASIEATRNREVLRLLEMLNQKPDIGLRFALPLTGADYRGLADPSSRLGERETDFSLKSLGGGKPADIWNLSPQIRSQLTHRYRELAAREMTLGRHRRAAYIFAALLGDLSSAAGALSRGRHWREAAVLYEERLHRPDEAAKCLREGGLWTEAIALYSRLGRHETVGDLYRQLEQHAEAIAAWQRAVTDHAAAGDRISAARILEHKLAEPRRALETLLERSHSDRQAQVFLAAAFSLLARQGWHDEAAALVAELPSKSPPSFLSRLVQQLVIEAQNYPIPHVRRLAADRARVVAAALLETAAEPLARELTQAVSRLVPGDCLLARDADRFVRQRQQVKPRRAAGLGGKLSTAFECRLPELNWMAAIGLGGGLAAAGYRDRELVLLRMAWAAGDGALRSRGNEHFEMQTRKIDPRQVDSPIVLAGDEFFTSSLCLHLVGHSQAPAFRAFPASKHFADILEVESHPGLSNRTIAMHCAAGRGGLYVVSQQGDLFVVDAYLSNTAQMLGLGLLDPTEYLSSGDVVRIPLPMLVRENKILLGVGRYLCIAGSQSGRMSIELPSAVMQLAASPPHTRTRVAVAMAQGGLVVWGDTVKAPQTPFATDMHEPKIALTRGGRLIAASRNIVEVYTAREGNVRLHATSESGVGEPLAVLTTSHVDRFAIVGTDGHVRMMRIEA